MRHSGPDKISFRLFLLFAFFLLTGVLLFAWYEQPVFLAIPALLLFAGLAVANYRLLYFLLFAFIPLSVEVLVGSEFTLKLPTEPMMAGFLLILLMLVLSRKNILAKEDLTHPVTALLTAHFLWMLICLIYTVNPEVSLKYVIAKSWYIATFFFMALIVLRKASDFNRLVLFLSIPLVIVTVQVLIRHAMLGFSFESVNDTVVPFFRNHVNYAALLSVAIPYVFFVRLNYEEGSWQRRFLSFTLPVLLIAVYYSYTRAAWVAILAAVIAYFMVRYRLSRYAVLTVVVTVLLLVAFMAKDKRYLDFAPDYSQTIYHPDLEDHLQATVNFTDLSTAERVYRWVAAAHMPADRPWAGVGPGNFYPVYKRYTVPSFRTYVSDNPEQSTVHNYYLLMLVEGGIIGASLFLLLVFTVLFAGERAYARLKSREDRNLAMAALLSFILKKPESDYLKRQLRMLTSSINSRLPLKSMIFFKKRLLKTAMEYSRLALMNSITFSIEKVSPSSFSRSVRPSV